MKLIVYSAITNNYDRIDGRQHFNPTVDYMIFHDREKREKVGPWRIRRTRNAKICKICSHLWLEDYDCSIYMDGNVRIMVDPKALIKEFLHDNDILLYKHSVRHSVYEEIDFLMSTERHKHLEPFLKKQKEDYRKEKVGGGLFFGGMLVRRNNDKVTEFNRIWWKEIQKYTERDQCGLVYALYKSDLKLGVIPGILGDGSLFCIDYSSREND